MAIFFSRFSGPITSTRSALIRDLFLQVFQGNCVRGHMIINNYPTKSPGISPDSDKIRRYSARLSRIISQQIDNKTNNFIRPGKKLFYLQFSLLRRTKLRTSQDICYLRITDIERIMTIFGQCYNYLLNNKLGYSSADIICSENRSNSFPRVTRRKL